MTDRKLIVAWMDAEYENFIDECGVLNYTMIAESCASALDHMEWLDDEDHFIWEYPIELEEMIMEEN